MKSFKYFFILSLFVVFSCTTKKDVLYLQNYSKIDNYKYSEYKLKIDDILKISVNTDQPQLSLIYNPRGINSNFSTNKENLLYYGYQVDFNGNIKFPKIGEVSVLGLTIEGLRNLLIKKIKESGDLTDPVIDVKLINAHFTILGEVNKPGRYDFLANNINLLDALGIAGDLTINGDRKEILLLRDIDNKKEFFTIDLTNTDFMSKKGFQIFSRDVIIVNPNTNRVKNAGIIGNSGTLLSLLSFLLSSIILIAR